MLGVLIGGALSYFFSGFHRARLWMARGHDCRRGSRTAADSALMMLTEPERHGNASRRRIPVPWVVLKIPTLWWIIASGALVNFNMYAIGTFMPAMFGRIYHLNVGAAGIQTGYVYLIGGIAGGIIGGWVGDHIIRSHKNGRLWMCAAFTFIGAPFAYYAGIATELSVAVILWTVLYASLNTYYGLVYSAIQNIGAVAAAPPWCCISWRCTSAARHSDRSSPAD